MMNPTYLNYEQTLVRIEAEDNHVIVVEPSSNPELWQEIVAGSYGPVAPYEPNEADGYAVPELTCSRLQAKAALLQAGLLDQANALISQMDTMTQLAWSEAGTWKRSSPLLNALAQYLTWPDGTPLTDEDVDELFTTARTIEV